MEGMDYEKKSHFVIPDVSHDVFAGSASVRRSTGI